MWCSHIQANGSLRPKQDAYGERHDRVPQDPTDRLDGLAVAMAFVLLVPSLLWPDVGEIGALGVSLKRRVDRTASTAQTAVERVDSLQTFLSTPSARLEPLTSSNSAVAQVLGPFDVNGPEPMRDGREHLPAKEAAFRRMVATARPQRPRAIRRPQSTPKR